MTLIDANLLIYAYATSLPHHPAPIADAWDQVKSWLDAPMVRIPSATEKHREVLDPLLPGNAAGSLAPPVLACGTHAV